MAADDRPEAVILCGVQGAGKTTFYVARFLETHVRISQDLLRTPHRIRRLVDLCLETRQPFVVDRVNATPEDRRRFTEPARDAGFRLVGYWIDAPAATAVARNAARSAARRVPETAIRGTARRLVPPGPAEGFEAVFRAVADGGHDFTVTPVFRRARGS